MLPSAVMLLPTPVARDTGRSPEAHIAMREDTGHQSVSSLAVAAQLLPTPTVADSRGTRNATADRTDIKPTTNGNGWTLANVAYADRWGQYAPAIHHWETVLGRPAPDPTEPGRNRQPRLSARFVEWMQGLPDGWVTAVPGLTRNQQLRLLGNGVVADQGAAAIRHLTGILRAESGRVAA